MTLKTRYINQYENSCPLCKNVERWPVYTNEVLNALNVKIELKLTRTICIKCWEEIKRKEREEDGKENKQ